MSETAAMKAELDALVREQADRRALREQKAEELKAQSQEYMTKQVQAAERYVQHRRELGKRKTKSGWSTDRPSTEPPSAFDSDEFGNEPGSASPFAVTPNQPALRTEAPRRPTRRPRPAEDDEDDDAFLNNRWRD
ncbi:hypothetical protein [Amycolatopsis echigonensis]|uniref:Uncharacterized protein n=1 Tax=Amycolatopsis echigonensis TaxID=2576905 RepID=A0A2N3WFF7_9PSEU|nr:MULTISPECIES: hypothetical protein [Amycolatopsis]MBB2499492.1 hypothetical protein [Amycolatopsis echigonensis]PKV92616.1 hypothetical protein ATK30_3438 [Amycolatopsis niigatensis]